MAAQRPDSAAWACGRQFARLNDLWWQRVWGLQYGAGDVVVAHAPANGRIPRTPILRRDLRVLVANNSRGGAEGGPNIVEWYLTSLCHYANMTIRRTNGVRMFNFVPFEFFMNIRPETQWYHRAQQLLQQLGIEGKKLLKVKYLLVIASERLVEETNLTHCFLIVISGVHRTVDCYDSLNVRRRARMMRALRQLFAYLSHELGDKFVPAEWRMRFRDTPFQSNTSLDCTFHACTFAMCVIYNWLPNYGATDWRLGNVLARTMRCKKKRIAAELLNGGFLGDFDYGLPNPYPDIPIDILGFHPIPRRLFTDLPEYVRRRRADLVNLTKEELTTFCEQEPGIGAAPNAHPRWRSWKKLRREEYLRNIEHCLVQISSADATIV